MIRTIKTNFICNKDTYNKLFECNRESAKVYNDILDLARGYELYTNGDWISLSELQKLTKRKYNLHSRNVKAVIRKFLVSRNNTKKAKNKGYDNKYSYKKKNNYNTIWTDNSFKLLDNNKIQLSLGVDLNSHHNRGYIYLSLSTILPDNIDIKTIELVYDIDKLKLCISYDDHIEIEENTGNNIASVDLGEIHSMACVCNNGESLIISGRKLRSINRFRNKKFGELQKKISKCKKGSRQYKKYKKVYNYIRYKSNNQINDTLHKTSRSFVNWCNDNEVSTVVIGDISGISKDTKKNKRVSRKIRQKLSQWSYDKLLTQIRYKQEQYSVNTVLQDESYTTQQCPCCGTRKKTSTRNYICSCCGYSEHRDIHSTMNIMSKYLYGDIRQMNFQIDRRTYLRII